MASICHEFWAATSPIHLEHFLCYLSGSHWGRESWIEQGLVGQGETAPPLMFEECSWTMAGSTRGQKWRLGIGVTLFGGDVQVTQLKSKRSCEENPPSLMFDRGMQLGRVNPDQHSPLWIGKRDSLHTNWIWRLVTKNLMLLGQGKQSMRVNERNIWERNAAGRGGEMPRLGEGWGGREVRIRERGDWMSDKIPLDWMCKHKFWMLDPPSKIALRNNILWKNMTL